MVIKWGWVSAGSRSSSQVGLRLRWVLGGSGSQMFLGLRWVLGGSGSHRGLVLSWVWVCVSNWSLSACQMGLRLHEYISANDLSAA
eukprot:gene1549-32931_t